MNKEEIKIGIRPAVSVRNHGDPFGDYSCSTPTSVIGNLCTDYVQPTYDGNGIEVQDSTWVVPKESPIFKTIKPKEETKMTQQLNRTERKVTLMDNTAGLPANKSKVFSVEVISDGDREEILQQVIMQEDIKGAIEDHNKVRENITDERILNDMGREVKLRPIELKDLTWNIQ